MLKYVSQILTKFTPQQRILALLLLLLSIVLMTNGTELINSIKSTPKDLQNTIKNQQEQIKLLQEETSKLNENIIETQRQCTNKIIEREKQIASEIDVIIKIANQRTEYLKIEQDSSSNKSIQHLQVDNRIDEMMSNLKDLKNSLSGK